MMKTTPIRAFLLAVLLCTFAGTTLAQSGGNTVDTTFTTSMNQIFSHLDLTKVPNGILRDYGIEFTNLENYNGTALADSNLLNKSSFFEIYNTLAVSSMTGTAAASLPSPNSVDSLLSTLSAQGQVTLAGLFYKYGYFSSDAVTNGKITVTNNQLYDKYVGGVYQNPYLTTNAVAFSPSYDTYQGKSFNLLLPSALWLSNSKSLVNHIAVDAGDGQGYRIITPGANLPVSYADTGMKTLNFKVYLTDNSVLLSHAQLHVVPEPLATIVVGGPNPQFPASHGFAPFQLPGIIFTNIYWGTSTASYQGKAASGFITVRYAPGHTTLTKPLIVVEGFDPGIYTHPTNFTGDYSINEFMSTVTSSYYYNSTLYNLLNGSASQYDIVFVDFHNGTDDMHRNALLLEDVIRWVNANKTGTTPNVVWGLSMGGVISRYALKKMENGGESHNVRLFINDGGPQQGAVVPVGYQYLENHVANLYARSGLNGIYQFVRLIFPQFSNYQGILSLTDAPAAQQMLVYRINKNFQMDNSVHAAWQTELTALGYPANCRNVAVSNGSECGSAQDLQVGSQLLYIDGKLKSSLFTDLITTGLSLSLHPTPQQIGTSLLSGVPGRNDILLHFEAYGAADGGGNLVYKGKVTYKKTILFLIPVYVTLTDKSFNAPAGIYPLESFEGDQYVFHSPLTNSTNPNSGLKALLFKYNISASQAPDFSFIPTTSALDIGKGSTALAESDYQVSYSGAAPPAAPKNSPFANFVTAHNGTASNEEHITFDDPHLSKWIAAEINAPTATIGCTALCSITSITGDAFNCNNLKPYSVPQYGNVNYSWTATSNIQIISGQGTGTVQIQPAANTNGQQGTLTVTMTIGDCGQLVLSKTINIGIEPLNVTSTVDRTPQASHYQYLTATATQLGNTTPSNYVWYQEVNGQPTTQIGSGLQLNHYPMAPGTTFFYRCQATTACGLSIYRGYAYNDYHGTSAALAADNSVVLYPNPANNVLSITNNDIPALGGSPVNGGGNTPQSYQAIFYNEKGQVIRSVKNQNGSNTVTFSTDNIPNGVYFLNVIRGDKVVRKTVTIQH